MKSLWFLLFLLTKLWIKGSFTCQYLVVKLCPPEILPSDALGNITQCSRFPRRKFRCRILSVTTNIPQISLNYKATIEIDFFKRYCLLVLPDLISFIAYTHSVSLFPLTFKYLYTSIALAWHMCQWLLAGCKATFGLVVSVNLAWLLNNHKDFIII